MTRHREIADAPRCCLCRLVDDNVHGHLEPTDLPGSGFRCTDRDACAERVREIVDAHVKLAQALR